MPSNDPVFKLAEEVGGKVVDLAKEPELAPKPLVPPQKRPLRIYWNSNHPAGKSGYCNQTRDIVARIKRGGTDIACGNFWGQEGYILDGIVLQGITGEDDPKVQFAKIPQYPKMIDTWGVDGMVFHAQDYKADCSISLQDIWNLDPNMLGKIKNWIPYVPIDHEPCPQIILDRLRFAYRIVTYSKFGYEELLKNGFHSTYIPHVVDTKQMVILDKKEQRKILNIPEDIYLFGMIGANKEMPSRKGFEHALAAFAKFHKKYPKSGLYLHANMMQPGGINLLEWTDANHYNISDCIYYLPNYELEFKVGRDQMTRIINTFDCLLAPSISEGFGLPIIEAQACGVPVITTNWTSMTELVEQGKTGFAVDLKEKRPSPLGSWFGIPDQDKIYEAMESIFEKPMDSNYIRQRIIDNYDADMVYEKYWMPFLKKLSDELI